MSKVISLGLAILTAAALVSAQAVAFHSHQEASQKTATSPKTAKQCGPGVAGTLFLVGLAFAKKSTDSLRRPLPCSDEVQEVRQKPREPEVNTPPAQHRLAKMPAAEALREARLLYIRPRSSWFNSEKLERELLKRKEFGEMGLEITRSANFADLILEITRKRFTTRFTCSIIEPGSERILAGATASSLGGEIEPHLADAILKQFKAVRAKPAAEEKK